MNCFRTAAPRIRGGLMAAALTLLLAASPAAITAAQSGTPTPTAVLFNIYRAATYTLNYPADWQITPRGDHETFFSSVPAPVCGQPGLLVTQLGSVGSKTADILLDDYTVNNSYLTAVGNRDDANDLGRFQEYRGPCTDGSTRTLRVAMFVAFGSGYRVTAFAPKISYAQWQPFFAQIDRSFTVTADSSGSGSSAQPVYAPVGVPDTLLVHIFNGNVFMATVADVPGTPITRDGSVVAQTIHYADPQIAPDGKHIAFIRWPGATLQIATIAAPPLVSDTKIAVNPAFPLAWSPDGTQIGFVTPAGMISALPAANGVPRTMATLPTPALNCATAPPLQDAAAAMWQTDLDSIDNSGNMLFLGWPTASLLIVSGDCTGGHLTTFDPNSGTLTPISALADVTHAALSADRSLLAGISAAGVIVLNSADLPNPAPKIRTLPLAAERIVWGSDDRTLYFTTRAVHSSAATPGGTASPTPSTPANTVYDVTLHQYNMLSSQESTLYSGPGYAIGSISVAPDGSGLVFDVIQADAASGAGSSTGVSVSQLRDQPVARLYWQTLPVHSGEPPTLLIDTLQANFGPTGSTALIGVPVTPRAGATNIPGG